ncbi:MAG: hypothetical protein K2Q01_08885 [Rickettsiales bacterium]|nr:hypothetical protein [Rickettsiales bacterium]
MTPSATDPIIIRQLNAILSAKLGSINQQFLHARILKHSGELKLADHAYRASIDAMKHSDMLVEHILSVGGKPNMQEMGHVAIGETPEEMLANDTKLAEATLSEILSLHAECVARNFAATAELLKRVAESQQEHVAVLRGLMVSFTSPVANPVVKDCA